MLHNYNQWHTGDLKICLENINSYCMTYYLHHQVKELKDELTKCKKKLKKRKL